MQDTPQIKAILKAIQQGKCKNQYAAAQKVITLRKRQQTSNKQHSWANYLAR